MLIYDCATERPGDRVRYGTGARLRDQHGIGIWLVAAVILPSGVVGD